MLKFIQSFLAKKEGKKEYDQKLTEFLTDGEIDDKEKKDLEDIVSKYGLTVDDLVEAKKRAFALKFSDITSDKKITEEEKKSLNELLKYFNVKPTDVNLNQNAFNKFYALGSIDKGILPKIDEHNLKVIFKENETLHWGCPAVVKKYKRVAQKINYSGFVGSIKIVKGLRYRVGSLNFSVGSNEYLIAEDAGTFWMTNQRIGFEGKRKNFAFSYSKIHSFELTPDGLFITKDGKEKPYILSLDDYEVPSSIFSYIINK